MPGPVVSPDGKYIWSGSEWAPLPPDINPNIVRDEATVWSEGMTTTKQVYPANFQTNSNLITSTDVTHNTVIDQQRVQGYPHEHPFAIIKQEPRSQTTMTIGAVVLLGVVIAVTYFVVDSITKGASLSEIVTDYDGDGMTDSQDPDDDNDGIPDVNDWFDKGNGGVSIKFTEFKIWSEGVYDSNGGLPDVYAYVGIGNSDCSGMKYFEYLDDINEDADVLYDWEQYTADIDDDEASVCLSVIIYDEDSWAADDVLDFVPGDAEYYTHIIDLSKGNDETWEVIGNVHEDNRGENDSSIMVAYDIMLGPL